MEPLGVCVYPSLDYRVSGDFLSLLTPRCLSGAPGMRR